MIFLFIYLCLNECFYTQSNRFFEGGGAVLIVLSGFLINTFLIQYRNVNMIVDIIEKGRHNILMILKCKMINKIVHSLQKFWA